MSIRLFQGVKARTLGKQNERNFCYDRLAHTSIFILCFMWVFLIKSNCYSLIYSSLGYSWHLQKFLTQMTLSNKTQNLIYEYGVKITPYINPTFDQMYKLCLDNFLKLWHNLFDLWCILLLTLFMDPETGCGLLSTSQKARLLIGTACWFWNSLGQISAAAVRSLAWLK